MPHFTTMNVTATTPMSTLMILLLASAISASASRRSDKLKSILYKASTEMLEINEEISRSEQIQQSDEKGTVGDLHFTGFDGSQFNFAGMPGNIFNIITDVDFQFNAFYAQSPHNNRTYMSQLGFKLGEHSVHMVPGLVFFDGVHELFAADHRFGDSTVSVTPDVGTLIQHAGFTVLVKEHRGEENGVDHFTIDCSANPLRIHHPHGVLGQTAKFLLTNEDPIPVSLHHQTSIGFIEGYVEDYVVSDGLFGTRFIFNRFGTPPPTHSEQAQELSRRSSVRAQVDHHVVNQF